MYHVPTMKEIEATPWNGFNVVSTFSGGGGSCLGYRMAGYRVLYAVEFIEEAQKTYKLNHPNSYLDKRDIRNITGKDILERLGMGVGEVDLFDGSPPCAAFSTAGKREKHWGEVKHYSDGAQRVDDLFFEYARLLGEIQPKVFIAENVSGLVKGTAKGYFKNILQALKDCGYEVGAKLINAKWLGVPQSRERIIFQGVRKDLVEKYGVRPTYPKPRKELVTLGDALAGIDPDSEKAKYVEKNYHGKASHSVLLKIPRNPKRPIKGSSVMNGSYFNLSRESMFCPCSTVCQTGTIGSATVCHPLRDRPFTIEELRRIMSVPDDYVTTGTFAQQWERLGRMVPPLMMKAIAETVAEEILCKI